MKKSKLYLSVALACSAAILPVQALAAEADGAAAEPKAAQEAQAAPAALDTFAVDGVVVTATRMPQAITDVPANVSVITAQEIEDNHYNSVSEALQNVNGVVVDRAFAGEQLVVELNGDDRVLVLVDGHRVNSDQGLAADRASADLSMLPPTSVIERIEVVKGGASALYGSDAVGGVINIITKKGQKDLKTTLDAAYGAGHQGDYRLTNQGSVKDLSWIVSGSLSRWEYFKTKDYNGGKLRMPNSDAENKNFSARVDYRMGDRESLTFGFSHVDKDGGAYTSYASANGRYKRNQNSADITWNFKEDTKAPGFLRYYHTDKNNECTIPGQAGKYNYKTDGVEYQNGWELGKDHVLIAGVDWRTTQANNDSPYMGYGNKRVTNNAVYVQDTWNISKKWALVPGLRVDHHNKYGTNWSPKIAVNFTPDKKNQLYSSFSRVFKAPMLDDLYTAGMGNPNLDPEKGYTANLGWNHEFNKKQSLGLNLFYTDIDDAINWKKMGYVYQAQNFQKDKKRGVELTYKQQLDKHWSYNAGVSFIHREIDKGDGAGLQRDSTYSAPNSYRLGINYKNRAWFAGLNTIFASGRNEAQAGNSSYALLNLNTSYQINDTCKVYLKALNLTNQFYSLGDKDYPGRGRFLQMGVQISF